MIVERPERILAGVMGISAAYVRLGEHYSGGRNAPHPKRKSATNPPFRIHRTSRTVPLKSDAVTAVHGTEWMKELQVMCDRAGERLATSGKELERTEAAKGEKKQVFHEGDLYLCAESVNAFEGALGGVCDGVDAVFEGTASGKGPYQVFVCIRPPGHHCSSDFPSGFCWINNVHVGIQHAVQKYGLTHAAIIDFDLHHGDGSQEITWGHNERTFYPPEQKPKPKTKPAAGPKQNYIGYFSLHDINSYPCENGDTEKTQNASMCIDNAHGQSVWNVHLQPWRNIAEFWELYENRYTILIEKARSFLKHHTARLRAAGDQVHPKAAIFLSAGFDASEHETDFMQRHKVNVPTEFYARFTRDVVALAQEQGTSVDGRVISVLEGGYSNRALISGVLSHISGLCDGDLVPVKKEPLETNGEMKVGLSGLMANVAIQDVAANVPMSYNTEWWDGSNLDALESLLDPSPTAPPASTARKPRTGAYSSPTHASTMKVVDPARILNRTTSMGSRMPSAAPSRAPSPPPPEVDWVTAAHELSKLLVPSDRETKSCTVAQLTEPKVKKEKVAMLPAAQVIGGRQLRDRKAKAASIESQYEEKAQKQRVVSTADRRRTIAELPSDKMEIVEPPRARRTSIASTISTTSVATTQISRPKPKTVTSALDIKKTRAPSTASAARAAERPPPVPRVPSGFTAARKTKSTSPVISVPAPGPAPQAAPDKPLDMDDLTSAIKKITIKVPSNEEYAARTKKGPPAAATKTAPKKPAAPRTTKTTTATKKVLPKDAKALKPLAAKTTSTVTAPLGTIGAGSNGVKTMQEAPTPQAISRAQPSGTGTARESLEVFTNGSSRPTSAPTGISESVPMQYGANVPPTVTTEATFQPQQFQPPPQPQQHAHYQPPYMPNQPLQWLPPNSDAAIPQMPKPSAVARMQRQTPVFSANGFIPFAPLQDAVRPPSASGQAEFAQTAQTGRSGIQLNGGVVKTEEDVDMWDLPSTSP
jgi:histone deacetylase HOS3